MLRDKRRRASQRQGHKKRKKSSRHHIIIASNLRQVSLAGLPPPQVQRLWCRINFALHPPPSCLPCLSRRPCETPAKIIGVAPLTWPRFGKIQGFPASSPPSARQSASKVQTRTPGRPLSYVALRRFPNCESDFVVAASWASPPMALLSRVTVCCCLAPSPNPARAQARRRAAAHSLPLVASAFPVRSACFYIFLRSLPFDSATGIET